ncbi:hypothetical protein BLNAU_11 [Blattamonas nauphoetae]|uniref:Uncharacterized protein n=1 Tax=Blattamonas nauphoetae TaxID=2049346 RepID=A0ABQ9YLS4_9EUKA|nr:hypothetical protein BLNAU_11 [Blattamonas nauphoetae]
MQTKLAPFIFTFAFFKLLSFILLVYTVKMDDISLISPSGFFFTSVLKIFFAVTLDSKYLSFTAFSHWVAAVYILIGFVMCAFLVYLQLIDDSRNLNETTENPQVPAQSAPDALQHELPIIKVLPSSTHLRMDPLNNTRLSCLVPQFSMSLISSLPFDDDSDDDLDDHIDGDSQQMRIKDDSDRRKEKKKERRMETLRRNEELMKKTSSSSFDSPLTFCDSISFEEEHADLAEDYLRYFYPDRRSGAEGM